jgi:hypothetical protein
MVHAQSEATECDFHGKRLAARHAVCPFRPIIRHKYNTTRNCLQPHPGDLTFVRPSPPSTMVALPATWRLREGKIDRACWLLFHTKAKKGRVKETEIFVSLLLLSSHPLEEGLVAEEQFHFASWVLSGTGFVLGLGGHRSSSWASPFHDAHGPCRGSAAATRRRTRVRFHL